MNPEQRDLLQLHLSPGIGRAALFKLHHHFGSFAAALDAPSHQWQLAGLSSKHYHSLLDRNAAVITTTVETLKAKDIRIISFWDADYPPLLRTIHDPPALLYVRGELPTGDSFAIVGSRKATTAGLSFTKDVATGLAEHGICVVSGMAKGVDGAAHRGALEAGGQTVAVLGCGIDRIYPAENTRLYWDILKHNAIISEYPPGTLPAAHNFPARNRIISGLCRGTLIVEAASGSGSLITADFALEQGRELFATPGAVNHPNSHGPHQLLKEGAQLVTDVSDILLSLWPKKRSTKRHTTEKVTAEQFDEPTASVYRQLGETPLHHDEIARKCALTPMVLSAILLDLELNGGARQLPGGHYVRGSS